MKKPAEYKGISFAPGYNKSLDEFIKEFENTHIFKNMDPAERKQAFKEAHKIATDGNIKGVQTEGGEPK